MSMKQTRIGDSCTHGAVVITGDGIRITDGSKVARRGDLVACPIHGINPIVTVTTTPLITSSPDTSHIGSVAACGAVIITGSAHTSHAK